jgi:hypothetical protein
MEFIIEQLGFASVLFLIFLFVCVPILALTAWSISHLSKALRKQFKESE